MSFDLYLHASEDQTRKIPKDEVDAAMTSIEGMAVTGKREYRFAGDGFEMELEVETETAGGGDAKGVYVHVASGQERAAYEKAKEVSLALVDKLGLVIYDHQMGNYVSREAFEASEVPDDGVMFRLEREREEMEAPARPVSAAEPTPPPKSGGCMGLLALGGFIALAATLL